MEGGPPLYRRFTSAAQDRPMFRVSVSLLRLFLNKVLGGPVLGRAGDPISGLWGQGGSLGQPGAAQ